MTCATTVSLPSAKRRHWRFPSRRQTALLVFLARSAGAGVVAADLRAGAHEGCYGAVVMMKVVMIMVVVIVAAAARVTMFVIMSVVVSRFVCVRLRVDAHRLGPRGLCSRCIA